MIYSDTVYIEEASGPFGERLSKDIVYDNLIKNKLDISVFRSTRTIPEELKNKVDDIQFSMSIHDTNLDLEILIDVNEELTQKEIFTLENWFKVQDNKLYNAAQANGQLTGLFGWLDKLRFRC